MTGTSELGRISEEVVATSETSAGGTELEAASGSGEEVGCATSDVEMTSAVLVAASGEVGTSDTVEEASEEGAGATSETTEVGPVSEVEGVSDIAEEASDEGAGASDMTEVGAVSAEAGMSADAGATEVSATEVAASGVADDSAPEGSSVGVVEAAGVSVTTALEAGTIRSA